jgi:hypothetical protein
VHVNNASDWLPACDAVIALIWGGVSGGVLERSLRLTETAGYSAFLPNCLGTENLFLGKYIKLA